MTDFNYKWISFWMTLAYLVQVVLNLATKRETELSQEELAEIFEALKYQFHHTY
jgi:hypothetical protein